MISYFERRFHSCAIEMGYNLRDACKRYRTSQEISLFWGIVTGQREEMVYHHQMKCIGQLLQHFIRVATRIPSQSDPFEHQARNAIVSEPNSPLSPLVDSRLPLFSLENYKKSIGTLFLPRRGQ